MGHSLHAIEQQAPQEAPQQAPYQPPADILQQFTSAGASHDRQYESSLSQVRASAPQARPYVPPASRTASIPNTPAKSVSSSVASGVTTPYNPSYVPMLAGAGPAGDSPAPSKSHGSTPLRLDLRNTVKVKAFAFTQFVIIVYYLLLLLLPLQFYDY